MKSLKLLMAAGLMALAGAAAISSSAFAADEPQQRGFAHGPEFSEWRMDQYRDMVMRMSPEDRSKLMAMQDKIMQMEWDQKTAMMKMDMDIAKAKRDMEFFVIRSAAPYNPSNR